MPLPFQCPVQGERYRSHLLRCLRHGHASSDTTGGSLGHLLWYPGCTWDICGYFYRNLGLIQIAEAFLHRRLSHLMKQFSLILL